VKVKREVLCERITESNSRLKQLNFELDRLNVWLLKIDLRTLEIHQVNNVKGIQREKLDQIKQVRADREVFEYMLSLLPVEVE